MTVLRKYSTKQRDMDRARILHILLLNKTVATAILAKEPFAEEPGVEQDIAEIIKLVSRLSAPDLADVLEALPTEERLALWSLVSEERRGSVLVKASETVWSDLIEDMSDKALLNALRPLDFDDQIYLAQYLPRDLMGRFLPTLPQSARAQVRKILHYDKHSVGAIMDFEVITVRADISLAVVQRYLRIRGKIPQNTDKLFVTQRDNTLIGELKLTTILLHPPQTLVQKVMDENPACFAPEDNDEQVARTFERDDLISAAVIDSGGKLMGRLTVDEIVDLVYEETDTDLRRMGGLSAEEDVFAPVSKAVRTRWAWLAINLCTAFIASRVIGMFEHTISELVALASLMPIVAGIGGNTGNQTITMIVRALALQHIQAGNISFLMMRELGVAVINGLVWGGVMGCVTWLLYDDAAMGGVMTLAMVLNLLLAALMGVVIPMTMAKLGRDPAVGSSVMITAITDTGGFFIFLGLATIFLL
ncbi:magnesium transporter [Klebsiella sp. BIGb0407]|uniref:magnesium transporter n=1 Tax=Klebsiella sp. BIGb0407 TaxID=2940603 RepID=UPI0021685ACD|nr:magnesium transporter [Klebsiella sp. BIGb0407]MCS3431630.1 magnesium transporter [Klebsiella sp. BIGb0407]